MKDKLNKDKDSDKGNGESSGIKFNIKEQDLGELNNQFIKLLKLLEEGDISLCLPKQYALVVFGRTQVGKTTLCHLLMNETLVGVERKFEIQYHLEKETQDRFGKIGTGNSETDIPNEFMSGLKINNEQMRLIDCPGYDDNKGCSRLLANAYFHYRVFSKVQKMKFLLVFDIDQIKPPAKQFFQTISNFLMSFEKYQSQEKDILNAMCFYFTKVPKDTKLKDIYSRLKSILQSFKKNSSDSEYSKQQNMVLDMISKEKIYLFQKAEKGVKLMVNNMLQKIVKNLSFWMRGRKDSQEVDTSPINFSVREKITKQLMNRQNINFANAYKYIIDCKNINIQLLLKSNSEMTMIINKFIKHCCGEYEYKDNREKSREKIWEIAQNVCKQFYIYESLSYSKQRNKLIKQLISIKVNESQQKWKRELIFLEKIYALKNKDKKNQVRSQDFRQMSDYDQIEWVRNSILKTFKTIEPLCLLPNSEKQREISRKLLYLMYRNLQQIKVFYMILRQPRIDVIKGDIKQIPQIDPYFSLHDISQGQYFIAETYLQKKNWAEIQQSFLDSLLDDPSLSINEQLIFQIVNHQNNRKNIKKLLKDKNEEFWRTIQKLTINKQNFGTVIKLLCYFQQQLKRGCKQEIIEGNILIVQKLGYQLQANKCYDYAIQCFKSIHDVYRARENYEYWFKEPKGKSKQDIITKLFQYSKYCAETGASEKATEIAQKAYSLIGRNHQKRKECSRLICEEGIKEQFDYAYKYFGDLAIYQYCSKLSAEFLRQLESTMMELGPR